MKDTLLIDLGNTNISLAVKSEDKFFDLTRFDSNDLDSLKSYLTDKDIGRVVMLSVAPRQGKIVEALLRELYKKIRIDRIGDSIAIPMVSNYSKESKLGYDRLLNAYFIREKIGYPAISVDIGSAITIDLISSKGDFVGGVIFPGFKVLAEALKERTEMLPEIDFNSIPQGYYGDNTEDSIKLGILTAVSSLVDRVIDNYRNIEGINTPVVLTGGDAQLLNNNLNMDIIYLPELTIDAISLLSS